MGTHLPSTGIQDKKERGGKGSSRIECITVLIYPDPEAGGWIAHCLEYDLLAHGRRSREAIGRLIGVISTHIKYLAENDRLEQLHHPAPKHYWAMLRNAKPLGIIHLNQITSSAQLEQILKKSVPPIRETARIHIEHQSLH